jgi:flagellar motor switch protein FliN
MSEEQNNLSENTEVNQSKQQAAFQDFNTPPPQSEEDSDFNLVMDLPINLTVELGKTHIPIKNLMQLNPGSVVELDSLAGEPLDIMVNGFLIAQGEVVVVNDKFGIRLTDIISPNDRIRKSNNK